MNSQKLLTELLEVFPDVAGCNSQGEVWLVDGARIQDRPDVAAIIAAHDPTETPQPTEAERVAALEAALLELMMGGL